MTVLTYIGKALTVGPAAHNGPLTVAIDYPTPNVRNYASALIALLPVGNFAPGLVFTRTPLNGGTYSPARGGTAVSSALTFVWMTLFS